MKIGILVDNPKRDVWGSLFLAEEAVSKGHEFYLIPLYYAKYDSFLLNLDCLIVNHARSDYIPFFKKLINHNISIYVLDTEGGLLASEGVRSPDGWAKWAASLELEKYISGYFFWGKRLRDSFKEYTDIEEGKLITSGNPRYDITSEKYSSLINKRNNSQYILINGNFASVNPKFSKGLTQERNAAIKSGWEPDRFDAVISSIRRIWKHFCEDIKKISIDHPDESFLFRPHPFEDEKFYENFFSECKNVKVECKGEVFEVIHNSSFLIHLACSTSVEANLLNKQAIQLEYLNDDVYRSHAPLLGEISKKVFSFSELTSNFSEFFKPPKKFNKILEDFGPADGHSAKRIISYIESNTKTVISFKAQNALHEESFKQFILSILLKFLGSFLLEKLRIILSPKRKDKFLEFNEIKEKVDMLNNLNVKNNLTLSSIKIENKKMTSLKISH